jgi:hypothetical protein
MTPTRPRVLLAVAAVSAAVGWGVARLVDAYANRTLPVPWTAALVMVVLAFALLLWARSTRARLQRRDGTTPLDPLVAARTAALAMAGSRTGALVAGFYLGVAVSLAGSWGIAYVRDQVVAALVTVLCSVAVVAVALWLERICRVPPSSPDADKP